MEIKKLYEILNFDKRFNGVDKEKQEQVLKFKHCSAEMLKSITQDKNGNIKLLSTGNFEGYTTEDNIEDTSLINCGEVITFPSGGTASIKYHNGKFIDSGNILASSKDNTKINLKYVYYSLLNTNQDIQALYRGSSIQHPSMSEIIELSLPLPPLSTQLAIVDVLDKFTELEKELEKELEMRKLQYQYYRDKLLTFTEEEREKWGVREVMIGECCEVLTGGEVPDDCIKGQKEADEIYKYPVYTNGVEVYGYSSKYRVDKKAVTISSIGNVGYVAYRDEKFFPAIRLKVIIPNDTDIDTKYLYYIVQCIKFTGTNSSLSSMNSNDVKKYEIQIPTLTRQKEIVEILDKFDTLVNDISKGLPRVIELRRKQYEYYRDRLLRFN